MNVRNRLRKKSLQSRSLLPMVSTMVCRNPQSRSKANLEVYRASRPGFSATSIVVALVTQVLPAVDTEGPQVGSVDSVSHVELLMET